MLPHDVVKGSRRPVQAGEPGPRPGDCVGDPTPSERVELALVAMRERVSEVDEVAVEGTIASATWLVHPRSAARSDPAIDAADTKSSEVSLDAREVGVAPIDEATLGRRRDKKRSELWLRFRQVHQLLSREPVQVSDEGLELGHHAQDVGVGNRPPDLKRSTWPVDFPHRRVGCRQGVDRFATETEPTL